MQIFLEDSHTRESTICHLTTTAAADAAVAVDGEAAAVVAVAAVADAAAAVVAAAADAAGDAAGPEHRFESGVDSLPITITLLIFYVSDIIWMKYMSDIAIVCACKANC